MTHKPKVDARQLALKVLQSVIDKKESLSSAIPFHFSDDLSSKDKAFAQMLVYGVLRRYWRLVAILPLLMQKKLKDKDSDIHIILLMALFQLMDTRVPDYASVDASVNLCRKQKKKWAAGMVNAVLRNFIRQQAELTQKIDTKPQAKYDHPQWMIDRLRKDWPENWEAIIAQNNQQAPMALRVNQQQLSVDDFILKLNESESDESAAEFDTGVVLSHPRDVNELPGFEEGWFSVQDMGAQKAATLLDLQPQQNILDCCAAPGGKTCHMLEIEPTLNMLALDVSGQRLLRVQDNLERLQLSAELVEADASHPDEWSNGKQFDRILLDVPCSAAGVIRRHPDIKLLRRKDDIPTLIETQQNILQKIWPLLVPGGKLLYATCSIFKDENENQIEAFLQQQNDAEEIKFSADWGHDRPYGRQILPGDDGMDGFYYALLQKK
jgi:16S rRNA (cytosine967-C5)-methyltransferase